MRKRAVRWMLKASLLTNLLFFAAIYFDATRNASRWMAPLLVLYGVFLLTLLLLLLARPQAAARTPEQDEVIGSDDTRLAIAQRP